jgi:hypothetical protein
MKRDKDQELILEQLKKIPIVEIACEKIKISRSTFYRWREDPEFAEAADAAMRNGELFINDLSEAQVVSLIKEKNWPAISFWLRAHHPRYAHKLELAGHIEHVQKRRLTPEEKALIEKSLRLAMPHKDDAEETPEKSAEQPAPSGDDTDTHNHESTS